MQTKLQSLHHRASNEIVHHARFAKAHFVLARVNVDVDIGKVDLDEQHISWDFTLARALLKSKPNRVADHRVNHCATVDEQELHVLPRAAQLRHAEITVHSKLGAARRRAGYLVDRQIPLRKIRVRRSAPGELGTGFVVVTRSAKRITERSLCTSSNATSGLAKP